MGMLDFEKFQLKDWWKKIKDNPEQMLLGAATPVGAKVWGGITGKDYDPLVNEFGGPTESTFKKAQDAGINTNDSEQSHKYAKIIAALMAGGYATSAQGGGVGNMFSSFGKSGVGGVPANGVGTGGNANYLRLANSLMNSQGGGGGNQSWQPIPYQMPTPNSMYNRQWGG